MATVRTYENEQDESPKNYRSRNTANSAQKTRSNVPLRDIIPITNTPKFSSRYAVTAIGYKGFHDQTRFNIVNRHILTEQF